MVVLAVVAMVISGCVRIDGGAVEMSWALHTRDGRAISDCGCTEPEVTTVRLHLTLMKVGDTVPDPTHCEGGAQYAFACQRHTGATPFEVPETKPDERYRVCVDTLGKDGAVLTNVVAPAPVLRSVVRGQPTDMGALLLVTDCATTCSGVNGQGVCARP